MKKGESGIGDIMITLVFVSIVLLSFILIKAESDDLEATADDDFSFYNSEFLLSSYMRMPVNADFGGIKAETMADLVILAYTLPEAKLRMKREFDEFLTKTNTSEGSFNIKAEYPGQWSIHGGEDWLPTSRNDKFIYIPIPVSGGEVPDDERRIKVIVERYFSIR